MRGSRALVILLVLFLLALLAWELYDPPGEEVGLLSITIGELEVPGPYGELVDLGPCTVEVSVFLDPGLPGLNVRVKVLCSLSRAPPPGLPCIYAPNTTLHITVALSGAQVAEEELPVGGVVLKAPGTPYQLLDEHEIKDELLGQASGLIEITIRCVLVQKGIGGLAEGSTRRAFLIPPRWALPTTLGLACITVVLAWWLHRRGLGRGVGSPLPPSS